MKYYQLDTPNYETDQEDGKCNPVSLEFSHVFPSLNCPVCGLWSSTNHLPQRAFHGYDTAGLPSDFTELDITKWREFASGFYQYLDSDEVSPGLEVGPCVALFSSTPRFDFLHIMPSQILVSSRVNQLLKGLGGYRSELVVAKRSRNIGDYFLLCPKVVMWQEGISREDGVMCEVCRREKPIYERGAPVQQNQREVHLGILNNNPCRLIVSEAVVSILSSHGLDENIVFEPV